MSLESIVRPFQLPNSTPPKQYVTAKQQSQPPVVLYFGRSGSGRVFTASFNSEWQRYQTEVVVEDKRGFAGLKTYADFVNRETNGTSVAV